MSKDTREFIHNKGGASLWDGVELQRDKMNVNAIAYTQAADLEGTIVRFLRWTPSVGQESRISKCLLP